MANAVQVWNPAQQLENVWRDFDNLFENFFGVSPRRSPMLAQMAEPRIESFIEGEKLMVRAEMPGVDPKNIEVTTVGNMLTIRATKEERHEDKGRNFLRQEISYGRIERSIPLPAGTTGEGIQASYRNGVLEISVPIPKELASRKVPVQAENGGNAGARREESKK
jgi:HSP20 family protein